MSHREPDFDTAFFESILKKDPKYKEVVEILGGLYNKRGDLDNGLKMDRKMVRLDPQNPFAHYNLGCSLAMKRRKADAVRALAQAIELGYKDYEWMNEDPDLMSLQNHPAFKRLLATIEP